MDLLNRGNVALQQRRASPLINSFRSRARCRCDRLQRNAELDLTGCEQSSQPLLIFQSLATRSGLAAGAGRSCSLRQGESNTSLEVNDHLSLGNRRVPNRIDKQNGFLSRGLERPLPQLQGTGEVNHLKTTLTPGLSTRCREGNRMNFVRWTEDDFLREANLNVRVAGAGQSQT